MPLMLAVDATAATADADADAAVVAAVDAAVVDAAVDDGLRAIQHHAGAVAMGDLDDAFGRRVGAQHVGHVGDGDQADLAVSQHGSVGEHVALAALGDRGD
eukprot:gene25549-31898_t